MKENEIRYLQPDSLEKLQELLKELTSKSVILAGGTDLMPKIRSKRPEIDRYVSLWNIEELKSIEKVENWLKIGAMVTHDQAAGDSLIGRYFRGLQMACSKVGSQQIRNKGTLCGNIANASPAGDIAPCVFLYGGEIEILSTEGLRRMEIDKFIQENGRTVLGNQEIITAIWLPIEEERDSCFVKLGGRTEVTIAQISLSTSWIKKGGKREEIKAYVGAIDTKPVVFEGAALLGEADEENLEKASLILKNQIREIRLGRTRESRLKITEAEKLYKERAAKGIIYDAASLMGTADKGKGDTGYE